MIKRSDTHCPFLPPPTSRLPVATPRHCIKEDTVDFANDLLLCGCSCLSLKPLICPLIQFIDSACSENKSAAPLSLWGGGSCDMSALLHHVTDHRIWLLGWKWVHLSAPPSKESIIQTHPRKQGPRPHDFKEKFQISCRRLMEGYGLCLSVSPVFCLLRRSCNLKIFY